MDTVCRYILPIALECYEAVLREHFRAVETLGEKEQLHPKTTDFYVKAAIFLRPLSVQVLVAYVIRNCVAWIVHSMTYAAVL